MFKYLRHPISLLFLALLCACAPKDSENTDTETKPHEFFSSQQLKAIHTLFPQGITPLYASDSAFEPNTLSMGINQQKEEAFLRLSYGKSNANGHMSVLKIEHYSKEQPLQTACKRREEKERIEHKTLGSLTVCKNHIRENIIGARILQPPDWPGNLNIQFSGLREDLKEGIQSLSPGKVLKSSEANPGQSFEEILRKNVPESGLLNLQHPEYEKGSSQINWSAYNSDVTAGTSYTRAIPFYEENVTLHFVVHIDYKPRNQTHRKGDCGNRDFYKILEHPELGPFLFCINESGPDTAELRNISKLQSYVALVYPLRGNKLQHVNLRVDGFPDEMEEILNALHWSP